MATQLLAVGTGYAASADFTIATGSQATIALKATAPAGVGGAYVTLQMKDDAAAYYDVDYLDAGTRRAIVLVGAGTYRLTRADNGVSCGVFRD